MANVFDQFDNLSAPMPSSAPSSGNAFDQFDGKPSAPQAQASQSQLTQPPWYPVAAGALPFGIAPRVQAATAAAKESLSGGLPFGSAYAQALDQYQNAAKDQAKANPTGTAIGNAVGSVLPLTLGGEGINAGLSALGPVGRFLAGTPDLATLGRNAAGQFTKITNMGRASNYATQAVSTGAQLAREGAQAGALGASQSDDGSVLQGAGGGAGIGMATGLLGAPIISALAQVARIPAAAAGALPHWAQGGLSLLGGEKILEHAPQLFEMAKSNPLLAATFGGGAGLFGASSFLAQHPQIRDALARMGTAGFGYNAGASAPPQ